MKEKELQEGLTSIPAWELNENSSQISRFFVAKNFVAAIDFFRRVADVAEEANHHPDLHLTDYRNVKVGASIVDSLASERTSQIRDGIRHCCISLYI